MDLDARGRGSPPSPEPIGGTETILFVEDNLHLRTMTGMMEQMGYRVLTAANAKEAMAILEKEESIDLLFTDIDMPGNINGLELATQVKAMHPDLTILLASGYDEWGTSSEGDAMLQGFSFLNKPYSLQEVDALIRKLLLEKKVTI